MHRKSVGLVLHSFSQGGTDRVAALLAKGFAERDYATELFIFARGGQAEAALMPILPANVKLTFFGASSGSRAWDLVRLFPAFVRALRRVRPQGLISTANNMNLITCLGRFVAGLRESAVALKTTNPIVRPGAKGLGESVRRFTYVRAFDAADAIWPLCDAEQALLIREFPHAADKIAAVQNPYVTQAMLAAFQRSARDGPPLVLAAGRLAPQKRLDLLVEAFADIPSGAAHLIIAGDGGERAKLEAIVKAHRLEDRVTLLGYVADVTDLLRRADLMVLTSVFEGLPAVVLEAMAVNCPVVSTDCFLSARALLETSQGCGIIEEETPAAIASLILARLADPRPTNLHETAQRWSIDNGIDSHVAGLERAVLRRKVG